MLCDKRRLHNRRSLGKLLEMELKVLDDCLDYTWIKIQDDVIIGKKL